MESCGADSKKQSTGIGTAYIVIREEKNVNGLGSNVPSLVPYDYSDQEDEKEDIKDGTQGSEDEGYYLDCFVDSGDDDSEFQTFYQKPGTVCQIEDTAHGSEDEGYYFDSFADSVDDYSEFQTFYHKPRTIELLNLASQEDEKQQIEDGTQGSEDEGYYLDSFVDSGDDNSEFQTFYHKPGTIEDYNISTTNRSCDVPHYIKILKDNGCSEASFCFSYPDILGFRAKLDKEQANKMKADRRIRYIGPREDMCLID